MPVTLDQFAAALKKKFPQYASVPDNQLVQAMLSKYPQYKSQIGGAGITSPKTEMHGTREDFTSRVLDRIGGNIKGMAELPVSVSEAARKRFLELHPENANQSTVERLKALPGNVPDLIRSNFDALYSTALAPAVKSTASMTGPGVALRQMEGEDPAAITGDALMMFAPGGEEATAGTRTPIDLTKAKGLIGSKTRGAALMDSLDRTAKDIPIEHSATNTWVQKALALEKYGWRAPAWMHAYSDMIESGLKGGKEPIPGKLGEFVDRPGSMNPLTYEHARNFESIAGATIDWDDPGGKMNALQKKAREALGKDIALGLKPYGLDTPYLRAKAEFTKAYGAERTWGPFGYFGGKLGGYGLAGWKGGYLGGKLGRSAVGSLVRSITEAGERGAEPPLEEAMRRPGGGIPPLDRLRMATDQLNLIRQRMAQNPGNFHDVTALRAAEDAVAQATKDVWGPKYAGAPKQAGHGTTAGGANYSPADLAALKKRMGIPMPAATEPAGGVAMKMFVTKADEAALRGLGYTDDVINKMKPDEASNIIRNQRKP